MSDTKIEWTDTTWNPLRGCSRVSEGCRNCYAERHAIRFAGPGRPYEGLVRSTSSGPRWTGEIKLVPKALDQPLRWRKPRRVFVNSMSDLFHEGVPDEYIAAVFGVMAASPRHTFQVLTKRPERARVWFHRMGDDGFAECVLEASRRTSQAAMLPALGSSSIWPLLNVHLGVSVEDQPTADERIPLLLQCSAAVRWVSYEPALGLVDWSRVLWPSKGADRVPVDVLRGGSWSFGAGFTNISDMDSLDWIVVGGESGPGARPFNVEWARQTIEQCREAKVPCFVKQLGSFRRSPVVADQAWLSAMSDRKGGNPNEWAADLRVREYPA